MNQFSRTALATMLALTLTLGSTGCLTTQAWNATANKSDVYIYRSTELLMEDSVLAIGQPNEASLKAIGDPHALMFLGVQHSYLLRTGGQQLLRISRELDGSCIGPAESAYALALKGDLFWGKITIYYEHKDGGPCSREERSKLAELGFKRDDGAVDFYETEVKVNGILCPAISTSGPLMQAFKVQRKLSFYKPPPSAAIPVIKRIVVMPVAVAADIVTSPLQLLGMGIILIALTVDGRSFVHF